MAKLVDALDLGSSAAMCESSSLSGPTIYKKRAYTLFFVAFLINLYIYCYLLILTNKFSQYSLFKYVNLMFFEHYLLSVTIKYLLNGFRFTFNVSFNSIFAFASMYNFLMSTAICDKLQLDGLVI